MEIVFQDGSRGLTRAAEPAFQRTGHDADSTFDHVEDGGEAIQMSPMFHNLHRGCYLYPPETRKGLLFF